ncbi:type IV pilus biogenesis protein PilM [Noviherbaspirillum massiliense]|uniref:type IV pilus biogenesis protein PilM n=1 Tax=Noviherbaspirillum massiliense TaxID=1465823 RepID=UPI000315A6E1|nr:hypothetical protein [Noviherbaspirillum massiliense]
MGLFKKSRRNAGYLAISFIDGGICAVQINRSASSRPAVGVMGFHALEHPVNEAALEKFAKEIDAGAYQCGTLLAPNEYQLLSVDAPNVPPDELKTAIRWRLKDMLDFHIDDATIDVLDVPVDKNAPTRNHSMFAVAARNHVVQRCQNLFGEAKIPLSVIDIPDTAQRNFSAMLEPEGRGVAMLSFDSTGGLLTITYSGELYLSRRIDITLAQIRQGDTEPQNACFDRVTLELQRSLDHFDRQYHFITVSKLVLAPLGMSGEALKDYLAANLYIPVESFDMESVLDISNAPALKSPESQQRYFLTLGAALRHEEVAL